MGFPVVGNVQESDYEQDACGELGLPELGFAVLEIALLFTNIILQDLQARLFFLELQSCQLLSSICVNVILSIELVAIRQVKRLFLGIY